MLRDQKVMRESRWRGSPKLTNAVRIEMTEISVGLAVVAPSMTLYIQSQANHVNVLMPGGDSRLLSACKKRLVQEE